MQKVSVNIYLLSQVVLTQVLTESSFLPLCLSKMFQIKVLRDDISAISH